MIHKNPDLRMLALPLLGKWAPFIILALEQKNYSFSELERTIPDITRKVLAENLKQLVAMGIINKYGKPSTGFAVAYELSSLGKSLLPIFYELKHWLFTHRSEILQNIENNQHTKKTTSLE